MFCCLLFPRREDKKVSRHVQSHSSNNNNSTQCTLSVETRNFEHSFDSCQQRISKKHVRRLEYYIIIPTLLNNKAINMQLQPLHMFLDLMNIFADYAQKKGIKRKHFIGWNWRHVSRDVDFFQWNVLFWFSRENFHQVEINLYEEQNVKYKVEFLISLYFQNCK